MTWDLREYQRRRRTFLEERGRRHPMALATTLIFAGTLCAGGLASWLLLAVARVHSMPLRYAVACVAAYGAFFGCVRLWCGSVQRDRGDGIDIGDPGGFDGDGCLFLVGLLLAAALVAGLFAWLGGFTLLLEVAFEVIFAGTMVRRLSRTEMVGNWAGVLLARTWLWALLTLMAIVGLAWALQSRVPAASTLPAAVRSLSDRR